MKGQSFPQAEDKVGSRRGVWVTFTTVFLGVRQSGS